MENGNEGRPTLFSSCHNPPSLFPAIPSLSLWSLNAPSIFFFSYPSRYSSSLFPGNGIPPFPVSNVSRDCLTKVVWFGGWLDVRDRDREEACEGKKNGMTKGLYKSIQSKSVLSFIICVRISLAVSLQLTPHHKFHYQFISVWWIY